MQSKNLRYATLTAANVRTRLFGPGLRQCRATVRNGARKGQKCTQPAVTGSPVCRFHGAGGNPAVREYLAKKRLRRSAASEYYWAVRWPRKLAQMAAKAELAGIEAPNSGPEPPVIRSDQEALLVACVPAAEYQRRVGWRRRVRQGSV